MIYNILSIIAILGVGILGWIQLREYFQPLRLLVTYLDCQPTGNNTSLVLFRLSFVNHSSRCRVVYGVDVTSKVQGIPLIKFNEEADSNLQTVTYSLSSTSRKVPYAETLQFPLDIPPRQSLSRWKAIAVSYKDINSGIGTPVYFTATASKGKYNWSKWKNGGRHSLGVSKKVLTEKNILLFPANKRSLTVDIYRELQLPIPL